MSGKSAGASSPGEKPRLNRVWHVAHPMPTRATVDQRIAWHQEHVRFCGCRGIPIKLQQLMRERAGR